MTNLEYVYKQDEELKLLFNWSKDDVMNKFCPSQFDRRLEELDCELYTCEECWNLSFKPYK